MFESLDAIKDSPIFTKYYETITIMEKGINLLMLFIERISL